MHHQQPYQWKIGRNAPNPVQWSCPKRVIDLHNHQSCSHQIDVLELGPNLRKLGEEIDLLKRLCRCTPLNILENLSAQISLKQSLPY